MGPLPHHRTTRDNIPGGQGIRWPGRRLRRTMNDRGTTEKCSRQSQTHLETASFLPWAGQGNPGCPVAPGLRYVCFEHLYSHIGSASLWLRVCSESSVCHDGVQMGRQTQHAPKFGDIPQAHIQVLT